MERLEFRAMGCHMMAIADSSDGAAPLPQVPQWFETWEQALSRFRDDSELNQLNRSAGTPFQASDLLWEVIQVSLNAARESNGLVTPTLLAALESAGYDRSFETIAPAGGPAAPEQPSAFAPIATLGPRVRAPIADWRSIKCDPATRSVCLPPGARLDFGGIAKGWAADQAARRLGMFAPALIDAGGDISISAPLSNGDRWSIGITDPAEPDRDLEVLLIARGGVATSGRDYRRWKRNGEWQHHIIDPRTGEPADTDVITATVIARTTAQAEMAAKKTLILGSQAGLLWLESQPDLAGVLVLESGYVLHSRQVENYMEN
jgi:thiamine biosynthesis lipoprotein